MASNTFHQNETSLPDDRQVHRDPRTGRPAQVNIHHQSTNSVDEENLRHNLDYFDVEALGVGSSRATVDPSTHIVRGESTQFPKFAATARWADHDEDIENDVPASLLVEANEHVPDGISQPLDIHHDTPSPVLGKPDRQTRTHWQPPRTKQQPRHPTSLQNDARVLQPRSLMSGLAPGGRREKALWRWVNITNLDSFMRDVYDYYEGGGLLCILCSNALWLLYVACGSKN